ncbi:nicotinate-nucleotide adenylyltransferase [Thermosulfidibacter takaii ABI70S6]|uniref:Probable nicotinate-nucleotide adenylyltransferase n=1 Tax=Thermosulfidibacter takaii (strain DSM 17441 / JCM 13301 / NBRC 103674 / ABI70S6) TaxID=1298851 RepID=A0A0S3QSQ2_THET7|nr:nicotinate-nucleotide adenylyltransferase [Thermosulfidibacter takaii]BAT71348.1 nicotinate-nucleotide adenylyltransferase [Thermosulfidibacter takaii ABI70S6]
MEELKRLGIFGGTFNPVHMGHLIVAENVRDRLSLDMVLFVPAHIPPHKSVDVAPARDRLEMVRLAVKDNPLFAVSDIELRRQEKSYTVDTLWEIKSQTNADLFFILGSEAFLQIHTWRAPEQLFTLSNFIVMERPGRVVGVGDFEDYLRELEKKLPYFYYRGMEKLEDISIFTVESEKAEAKIYLVSVINIGISSTMIRRFLREGRSIKYLVPKEVETYIKEKGLYRG